MLPGSAPSSDPEILVFKGNRRRLVLWLLATGLIGFLAWFAISALPQFRDTSGLPRIWCGDFYEFYSGAQALANGTNPYSKEVGWAGYIYPPLLAFLLQPLARLDIEAADALWTLLNLALLSAAAWLGADDLARRLGRARNGVCILAAMLLSVTIMCDVIRLDLRVGQTQPLLVLCWILGLRWMDRRPLLAGLALGLAANVKYISLAALPYFIVRRRWRAAGATVIGTLAWALLPAVQLGWSTNSAYLRQAGGGLVRMVSPPAAPDDAARVQRIDAALSCSITSMAVRELGTPPLNGHGHKTLGVQSAALTAAILGTFVAAIVALYRRHGAPLLKADRSSPGLEAVEWSGLLVALLAFSPQTNPRHLVLVFPMALCLAAYALIPLRGTPRWPVVVGIAVLVIGLDFPPGNFQGLGTRQAWQHAASPIWCMIAAYLLLLWTSLHEQSMKGESPARARPG